MADEGNLHTVTKKICRKLRISITDFPKDVLIEILTRLPLKSLATCKCLSKILCDSGSPNSYFNKLHSPRSPQALALQFEELQSSPTRSLHLWDPEADVESGLNANWLIKPLFEIPNKGTAVETKYNLRSRRGDEGEYVLTNSCNGLLYLTRRDHRGSVVCNPVTNEYFFVSDTVSGSSTTVELLGFSYIANRYKALRLFDFREQVHALVEVVGVGWWRRIPITIDLGPESLSNVDSVFLNGRSFWISYSRGSKKLVYFNFVREWFGEIELPGELELEKPGDRDRTSIGVLGDSLCVSYNDYEGGDFSHRLDFWVMRDQGRSWMKHFVIETMRPRGSRFHGMFRPLQVLSNGEILMLWVGNDLVCYNPANKSLKFVKLGGMKKRPVTIGFNPSFVSLKNALVIEAERVMTQSVRPKCMRKN